MDINLFLRRLCSLLLPVALLSTVYVYLYPVFNLCNFPTANSSSVQSFLDTLADKTGLSQHSSSKPPFRLLVFGDPQLEGDSSLPDPNDLLLPNFQLAVNELQTSQPLVNRVISSVQYLVSFVQHDIRHATNVYRKRIDLLGNDFYLAHIYRTIRWWSRPSHITVVGDLLGSQWLDDAEFTARSSRFWKRVFNGAERVPDNVTRLGNAGEDQRDAVTGDILGENRSWENWIINVVGNHDVGYSGDMTTSRVLRFEKAFGPVNWETHFYLRPEDDSRNLSQIPATPELRLVVLNSLNLDGPAIDYELQKQTYDFINAVIARSRGVEDRKVAVVLLTHIPLAKPHGICPDGPYFKYREPEFGGTVIEQNHLSSTAGLAILEGIYGLSGNPEAPAGGIGRPGIILNGHDHEGCDTYHTVSMGDDGKNIWNSRRWARPDDEQIAVSSGIREITVRSMMGEFGGHAGLLSGWYDWEVGKWHFEYASCNLGVQHIWWAVHIMDVTCIFLLFLCAISSSGQSPRGLLDSKTRTQDRRTT